MFKAQIYVKAGANFKRDLMCFVLKCGGSRTDDPTVAASFFNDKYPSKEGTWGLDTNGNFILGSPVQQQQNTNTENKQ